jgi:hypothetical protein
MNFTCRLDRRKYHEEFWELYYSLMEKTEFETREEMDRELLRVAHESFKVFDERYPSARLDFFEWWELINEAEQEPTECPTCGELQAKVIYMGAPGRLCKDPECATIEGMAEWVARIWFDGLVFFYTGSYLSALWTWLTKNDMPDPIDYN